MEFDGKIKWSRGTLDLMIAIPKKRGTGFLRQPIGHHVSPLEDFVRDLSDEYGFHIFDGLDGFISIQLGYNKAHNKKICFDIVSKIASFLEIKIDYTEVSPADFLNYLNNQ